MAHDDPLLTRKTLLIRLRDPGDNASWSEFADIYTPLFYGFCLKRGLGHADAADVVQDVMRSVARAMRGFEYDPEKGRFKTWLFTAVRNAIHAHFNKQSRRPVTASRTQEIERINAQPDEREHFDWERDYRRQLLAWAMEKIKGEFSARIWTAFEQTALRGRTPTEVAPELDMTPNAVAVAKHRITQRLRAKAQSVDAERWEDDMIARDAEAGARIFPPPSNPDRPSGLS